MKTAFALLSLCSLAFCVCAFAELSDIQIAETSLQNTLVIRVTTEGTTEAVNEALNRIFPRILEHLDDEGSEPLSPPFARFYSFEPGVKAEFEAGFAVESWVTGEAEIFESKLPATTAATLVHVGPYETLGTAYEALHTWMASHGYQPAGAPWEVYLNNPKAVAPESVQTQIYYPIQ